MTISEYREKYGGDLKKQEAQPWFVALLAVLESEHPLFHIKEKKDGDRLAGGAIYLSEILGYQNCLDVIAAVRKEVAPDPVEEAPTYEEDEIQIPKE